MAAGQGVPMLNPLVRFELNASSGSGSQLPMRGREPAHRHCAVRRDHE